MLPCGCPENVMYPSSLPQGIAKMHDVHVYHLLALQIQVIAHRLQDGLFVTAQSLPSPRED